MQSNLFSRVKVGAKVIVLPQSPTYEAKAPAHRERVSFNGSAASGVY